MKRARHLVYILNMLLACHNTFAYDFSKLRNNKEIISFEIGNREERRVNRQERRQEDLRAKLTTIFNETNLRFENTNRVCGVRYISIMKHKMREQGLINTGRNLKHYLAILRQENLVDDLYYKILTAAGAISKELYFARDKNQVLEQDSFDETSFLLSNNNIERLYADFIQFPNENETCILESWMELVGKINFRTASKRKRNFELRTLNRYALAKGHISSLTFEKLEILRESKFHWNVGISFSGYLAKLMQIKDKFKTREDDFDLEGVSDFPARAVSRFASVSHRERLYRKFSRSQILLMADVMKKTAMRMGVDSEVMTETPYIQFDYVSLNDGSTESERYELSPAEQYFLARRMLRQEIFKLNQMRTFEGASVSYADIVTASVETGYILLGDLQTVLTFDDLWNPEKSAWQKFAQFMRRLAGVAVAIVPTPFNYIGATALATIEVTRQAVRQRRGQNPENDNPNNLFR